MVESNRLKKKVREHMAANPGVSYQRALTAIASSGVATTADWLKALGGAPPSQRAIQDRWNKSLHSSTLVVPVGVSIHPTLGETVFLDLAEPSKGGDGPHIAIVGTSGSGKTNAVMGLLLGLSCCYHPDRLQFAVAETHKGSLTNLVESLPHATTFAGLHDPSGDETESAEVLAKVLNNEIQRREGHLLKARTRDIHQYRQAQHRPSLRELIIVLDDAAEWMSHPGSAEAIKKVSRKGRSLGVHLVSVGQPAILHPPAAHLMDMSTSSVVLGVATKLLQSVEDVPTEEPATSYALTGEGELSTPKGMIPVRLFEIDAAAVSSLSQVISSAWAAERQA